MLRINMCDFSEVKLQMLKEANEKMGICEDQSVEKNKNIIFVYCPPKVGSTSLVTSFRLCALKKYTIYHIHDELMLKVLCGIENVTINEIINYNKSLGKNVFVIDIYRSPIEHKISVFFEKVSSYHFNNTEENVNAYPVVKIFNRFNSLFPHLTRSDYYKEVYNIPFPESFDFERKFLLQEINGIKYIKLRLKDSDEWDSILNIIFQTHIKIVKDYETEKKPIKDIYKQFKENYMIPSNLFQLIENCEALKYYYSPEERTNYLNGWSSRQTEIVAPFTENEYIIYNKITSENQHIGEVQRNHYIDVGCSCTGCARKRQIMVYKLSIGESVDETIDHNQANEEYKMLVYQNRMKKLQKFIADAVNNQNKIKSVKPKNIVRNSFTRQFK
jgi:hypothetical protein